MSSSANQAERQPINLQSNYPVLPDQEVHWKTLMEHAVRCFGAESWRLPPFAGGWADREKAAAWLRMPVERTSLCTSGHQGTMAALLAAGLAGKAVAVEALTYPWFVRQAQMLGMRVVPVALDREGMRVDALREACLRQPLAAVYTMPTQHNPTGAVASLERRLAMVEIAREFGLLLIEDGAYSFLQEDEPPRYVALAPERAFYVESLSKRVAPGLRTAFLVAPEGMGGEVEAALRVMTSGSATMLTGMGCAMAADGSLTGLIAAKRAEGARRQRAAREILRGVAVEAARNSWTLWVTLPEAAGDDMAVERRCEEHGVLVTGARWFTAPEAEVPRAVRLGLGGEIGWERVAEGLRVFREVVMA